MESQEDNKRDIELSNIDKLMFIHGRLLLQEVKEAKKFQHKYIKYKTKYLNLLNNNE
jgi:hypothetical protein